VSEQDKPEPRPDAPKKNQTSRRAFMVGGAAAIGAAAAARAGRHHPITDAQARLLDKVTAASAGAASLSDVKHVVILMQENRSFDHYFGTLSGVRGFSDPAVPTQTVGGVTYPVFDQFGYQPGTGADASGYLQPFNLLNDPPAENGEATNDIAHDWVTQHHSWNGGKMDSFIHAHLSADGTTNGPVTMGYFTRSELAFYYALADAFTVCDNYFCSVLGPTDPNRLMAISATIDPAGAHGGPVITTASDRWR
jgi:phospholipase C